MDCRRVRKGKTESSLLTSSSSKRDWNSTRGKHPCSCQGRKRRESWEESQEEYKLFSLFLRLSSEIQTVQELPIPASVRRGKRGGLGKVRSRFSLVFFSLIHLTRLRQRGLKYASVRRGRKGGLGKVKSVFVIDIRRLSQKEREG